MRDRCTELGSLAIGSRLPAQVMQSYNNLKLKSLCHEINGVCTKILEKSDFLLFVNNTAAQAVRSEILAMNADVSMVEIMFAKGIVGENALFSLIPGKVDALYGGLEACQHYLSTALKATTPDTKATNLANILCQVLYLAPSAALFTSAIRELQEYRRSVSESLKGAVTGNFSLNDILGSETRESLLQSSLEDLTEDAKISRLVEAQNHLFAQLWLELPHRISAVRQAISSNAWESANRLDGKLRDTLIRRLTSKYMMVFVGAQSSGKSTFLNAFVGKEFLPSHGTPTTTYPCRIRHVSGKTTPELHLSRSLENGLICLRKFNWLDKYQRYTTEPRTWTGSDLPVNMKARSLAIVWEGAREETQDNYRLFMDPDFSIPSVVYGQEQILDWVQKINDIASLCRAFGLPFETFLFEDWAVIMYEFLKISQIPGDGFCEIIDIPGLDDRHSWDEVIQEVIRHANAIVPIVSLETFRPWSYTLTASMISKTTALPVSAVVLTKMESIRRDAVPTAIIQKAFWKSELHPETKEYLILRCSVLVSNGAAALLALIEQKHVKPPFEDLVDLPFVGFFGKQGLADAKDDYDKLTLEELKTTCADRITRMKVEDTLNVLRGIISQGVTQQQLSEMGEIEIELRSIKRLLTSRGLAPAPTTTPAPAIASASVEKESILKEWAILRKGLQEEFDAMIATNSSLAGGQIRFNAKEAIQSTLEKVLHITRTSPSVDFFEIQDLHTFIAGVKLVFSTLQSVASEKVAQKLFEESRANVDIRVSSIQKSIAALPLHPYQLAPSPWPASPAVEPLVINDLLTQSDAIQKGRTVFDEWRNQLHHRLSIALQLPTEPSDLSNSQRYLVSFLAVLSFPIRGILGYQTPFILDLDKVETTLETIGNGYWEETRDVLRKEFQAENDPIWEAAHLAIMMALAGTQENQGFELPVPDPRVIEEALEKVGTIITANLEWLHSLLSTLTTSIKPDISSEFV